MRRRLELYAVALCWVTTRAAKALRRQRVDLMDDAVHAGYLALEKRARQEYELRGAKLWRSPRLLLILRLI